MADESKSFRLEVISPDRIFFEDMVDMVELRTTEGNIGILKGHIPLTAIVAPGIMKIKMAGGEKEAALHDGFIEILKDKVTVMAESCEWPEEIDINRANEAKIRAERRLKGADGEINESRAELSLRRALTRLELSSKYGK